MDDLKRDLTDSANLEQLRERYLELINQTLPNLAKQRPLPVQLNHCFGRIILDNLFGCCWYEALDQRPAYRQLTAEQLQQAIAIAEAILAQPEDIHKLNRNSLRWRGHSPNQL